MASTLILVGADGSPALVSWCRSEGGRTVYEVDGWVRELRGRERIVLRRGRKLREFRAGGRVRKARG